MPNRIAINTIATYTRMVISAGLSLFGSRWVLNALGQTDYGLFSVVGSIIMFITFLNTVMSVSASRHFAYSIGQGDASEVNRWFNSALGIHLCLASLLILIGWPIGEYVVDHILRIPFSRLAASRWVFRISLVSAFTSMISVPFVAMFTAKQHICELAVWGMLQTVMTFALAWSLAHVSGDRLLFYSAVMVIILVSVQAAQICRAFYIFDECRIVSRECLDRRRLKEIFSFASWTLIGGSGSLFRDQGSAILLNLCFGPSVNAAYGIATQLSNQANQLSAAMIGAFAPEITACEGRGDRKRMLSLSHQASKFGTILVLILAVPLMVEMDYVLKLWLHAPPPHTTLLCRFMLGTFLIDRLTSGYMLAVAAHGRIAAYQLTLGTILVLTLPLAWFFLERGLQPASIGIAFIITMAVTSVGRVLWGRHFFATSPCHWLFSVVWPAVAVAMITAIVALIPCWLLRASLLRFCLVTASGIAASLLTTWFIALDLEERESVVRNWSQFLRKCGISNKREKCGNMFV